MAITRRTDYAVRLMYELAQLPVGANLTLRDLCEAADVPDSFGTSIVQLLIDSGLVRAEGYRDHLLSLAQPATEVTMANIIRACEPEFSLSQCSRGPGACDRSSRCGVHKMWSNLDALVWQQLDSLTLAEVATGQPGPFVGSSRIPSTFAGLMGTA